MANPMEKLQALKQMMAKAKGKGKAPKSKATPVKQEPDGDEMTRPGIPASKASRKVLSKKFYNRGSDGDGFVGDGDPY